MPTATNPAIATRIVPADPAGIAAAAAAILAGQPVAVPTETVYGLAADASDGEAVARIYAAKRRPAFNPLIVHVADLAHAERLADFGKVDLLLAERFWPGPLTLVLPRRADSGIAAIATAGLATIAIRIPAHPAMRALLAATRRPLAAPSANASGAVSPTRASHVAAGFDGRVGLVLDGGACAAGVESTIVRVVDDRVAILRPGPVTRDMLAQATGLAVTLPHAAPGEDGIVAPGQLARHYAPGKPLRLNAEDAEPDEYLIGFGAVAGDASLSDRGNPIEAAARLFDALHIAAASDRPRIAVAAVPDIGIGRAINDRLARAASA